MEEEKGNNRSLIIDRKWLVIIFVNGNSNADKIMEFLGNIRFV
jgi:hypothetical protein